MAESDLRFSFRAEVWEHEGQGGWHFVSVPEAVTDEIDAAAISSAAFGSIRVEVTIGATTWATSLFPDTRRKTYLLPVKKVVRQTERLAPGSTVTVVLVVNP